MSTRIMSVRCEVEVEIDEDTNLPVLAKRLADTAAMALLEHARVTSLIHAGTVTRKEVR